MNKKIGILLIITILFLATYLLLSSTERSKPALTSPSSLEHEQHRVLKTITKKLQHQPIHMALIVPLNDFTISTGKLLQQHSATNLQHTIEQEISVLTKCLKKDFCGMKENKEKGYFDEAEVGGEKNLRHILHHLNTLVDQKQINPQSINLPFKELFTLPNNDNKILAAKLFLLHDDVEQQAEKLLQYESAFTAESRGQLYSLLLSHVSPNTALHAQVITSILKAIQSDDSYMVLTILEETKNFNLTENELFEIIKESCRFKTSPEEMHNWNMVRLALQDAVQAGKFNLSVSQICN